MTSGKRWRLGAAALAAIGVAACGGSSDGGDGSSTRPTTAGYYIAISGMRFAPLDLRVPAGATVTVINDDSMAHSVTSEATAGAYTPGAVGNVSFDTGAFNGVRSFTVSAAAAAGTVIPYYCSTHLGGMATPNGSITIDPAAQPAFPPSPPGSGGSGGGGGGGGGGGY